VPGSAGGLGLPELTRPEPNSKIATPFGEKRSNGLLARGKSLHDVVKTGRSPITNSWHDGTRPQRALLRLMLDQERLGQRLLPITRRRLRWLNAGTQKQRCRGDERTQPPPHGASNGHPSSQTVMCQKNQKNRGLRVTNCNLRRLFRRVWRQRHTPVSWSPLRVDTVEKVPNCPAPICLL
jgi:hypothetical protein